MYINLHLGEKTLQKTLARVLKEVYEPQNEFQKMHSIYMPWYHTISIYTGIHLNLTL